MLEILENEGGVESKISYINPVGVNEDVYEKDFMFTGYWNEICNFLVRSSPRAYHVCVFVSKFEPEFEYVVLIYVVVARSFVTAPGLMSVVKLEEYTLSVVRLTFDCMELLNINLTFDHGPTRFDGMALFEYVVISWNMFRLESMFDQVDPFHPMTCQLDGMTFELIWYPYIEKLVVELSSIHSPRIPFVISDPVYGPPRDSESLSTNELRLSMVGKMRPTVRFMSSNRVIVAVVPVNVNVNVYDAAAGKLFTVEYPGLNVVDEDKPETLYDVKVPSICMD